VKVFIKSFHKSHLSLREIGQLASEDFLRHACADDGMEGSCLTLRIYAHTEQNERNYTFSFICGRLYWALVDGFPA